MEGSYTALADYELFDAISQTRQAVARVSDCVGPAGCRRALASPERVLLAALERGQALLATVAACQRKVTAVTTTARLVAELDAMESDLLGLVVYLRVCAMEEWTLRAALDLGRVIRRLRRALEGTPMRGDQRRA